MRVAIALALTVMTGFTGLVYEVTWQKYLAALLGSHSEATAAVLAIFLGGLSAGYALFGRMTETMQLRARAGRRSPPLLLVYAVVEATIGIYALIFPGLFGGAQILSQWAPAGSPALGFLFDVLLATLLIAPPSILMGGTIPILTLALSRSLEAATRIHAWVYGFNTLGAFAGALVGGFLLIPALGLDGVSYAMGGLNLMAAAVFLILSRGELPLSHGENVSRADDASSSAADPRIPGLRALLMVAALSGFAMMTVQTILNRVGALAFGASMFTFAMVVAVFVLAIALGSLAVSALSRISLPLIVLSQWALVLLLFLVYGLMPDFPYYAHVVRSLFQDTNAAFYSYQFFSFVCLLAVLLLPIGLSGALLPLLFHHLRQALGDLGKTAGRLYSWNTIGSLLGALLGGYVLLFFFDLHVVYRIALAAVVLCAGILTVVLLRVSLVGGVVLVLVPALVAIWSLPEWDPERLDSGLFRTRAATANTYRGADQFFADRERRIVFHRDGPSTTATVRRVRNSEVGESFSLSTNGKPDGSLIGDYPTMALAALIPALLAENTHRSFVIGYGTGVTAGELASMDEMREVHVAEISQSVMEAAPYFEIGNQAPLASPKLVVHRSDAYRSLLRAEGLYDVIVSEPSNPWVSGTEMLFSQEFLEAAKQKLSPGGVYAQWFHLYEIDDAAVELVLRTYLSVFEHVSLWFTMESDLVIMGIRDPERALDIAKMRARFERPDFQAAFARVKIENLVAVFSHELVPLGVLNAIEMGGPVQTLRHPRLSHIAARAFFRDGEGRLPDLVRPESVEIASRNSLLRRLLSGGQLPPVALGIAATENCRFDRGAACATYMAQWEYAYPRSEVRAQVLEKLRKNPHNAPELRAEIIENLLAFYSGKGAQAPEDRPVVFARRQTNRYIRHFNLAIPFDRRSLENIWRSCDRPPCDAALRRAESRVGPLDIYSREN